MKPTILLISAATAIGGFTLMGLQGQTPTSANPLPAKGDLPLGRKCIVSVDPHSSRVSLPASEIAASGFEADGTARGELIRLSEGWCVLKDGEAESWIPTEKILLIRASE